MRKRRLWKERMKRRRGREKRRRKKKETRDRERNGRSKRTRRRRSRRRDGRRGKKEERRRDIANFKEIGMIANFSKLHDEIKKIINLRLTLHVSKEVFKRDL